MVQIGRLTAIKESTRRIVIAAAVSIALVAVYRWTVAPQLTYLKAIESYRPVVEKASRQATSLAAAVQTRRRLLEQAQQELAQMTPQFFTPHQAEGLSSQIEAMASNAGCMVTGLFLEQSATRRKQVLDGPIRITQLAAEVVIAGRYDAIIAFLQQVQKNGTKIYINSMTIEPTTTTADLLQCRLSIVTYIRQQEEVIYDE